MFVLHYACKPWQLSFINLKYRQLYDSFYLVTYVILKGTITIRLIFSLVAHDYKDRIFKLVPNFRNLHGSVGKYINFSIGVTLQQFVAFKFVKICVFRTHPSFFFFTLLHRIQFRSKFKECRYIFKGTNSEM